MIQYVQGNILDAQTDAIVNPVNTDGIMGKGLALQIKERFPDNFAAYRLAWELRILEIGRMHVHVNTSPGNPTYIINFPTKASWYAPSRMAYIYAGLVDLARVIIAYEITSIAIPALGCGNGGLKWSNVRPRIEAALSELKDVNVYIYVPHVERETE